MLEPDYNFSLNDSPSSAIGVAIAIAVTDDQVALAEAVGAFTARVAPMEETRKLLDSGPRNGGGTVEMQLNMIGERILGLPRS